MVQAHLWRCPVVTCHCLYTCLTRSGNTQKTEATLEHAPLLGKDRCAVKPEGTRKQHEHFLVTSSCHFFLLPEVGRQREFTISPPWAGTGYRTHGSPGARLLPTALPVASDGIASEHTAPTLRLWCQRY